MNPHLESSRTVDSSVRLAFSALPFNEPTRRNDIVDRSELPDATLFAIATGAHLIHSTPAGAYLVDYKASFDTGYVSMLPLFESTDWFDTFRAIESGKPLPQVHFLADVQKQGLIPVPIDLSVTGAATDAANIMGANAYTWMTRAEQFAAAYPMTGIAPPANASDDELLGHAVGVKAVDALLREYCLVLDSYLGSPDVFSAGSISDSGLCKTLASNQRDSLEDLLQQQSIVAGVLRSGFNFSVVRAEKAIRRRDENGLWKEYGRVIAPFAYASLARDVTPTRTNLLS